MFALVEAHPNFDAVIFYLLAAATVGLTLYYRQKRFDSDKT
jgi:hypothetical protein